VSIHVYDVTSELSLLEYQTETTFSKAIDTPGFTLKNNYKNALSPHDWMLFPAYCPSFYYNWKHSIHCVDTDVVIMAKLKKL